MGIGGDTPINGTRVPTGMTVEEEVSIWNALGSAIDSVDANHLITFHPLQTIPSIQLGNPTWLDFNMLQTGRGTTSDSINRLQTALQVGGAVVDGESLYENLAYEYAGEADRRTAFQIRDDAYSQLFVGAFGNTYGHNTIYRFWESTDPAVCTGWICTPNMTWREALDSEGGMQMQYITDLMESRPIIGRLPDQSLIEGTPPATDRIVATIGNGYGLIYSADGDNITVIMGIISGDEVKDWWYNPRSGMSTFIGDFENIGTHTFDPPGEPTTNLRNGNDWILVLDDINRSFNTPGR